MPMKQNFCNFLLWIFGYYKDPEIHIPSDFVYPNPESIVDPTLPTVTWLGHSTFLMEISGIRFLTDPVWCEKLSIVGPKRLQKPPVDIVDLPPIDYVLISHNH